MIHNSCVPCLLLQLQVNAAKDTEHEGIAAGFNQLCNGLLQAHTTEAHPHDLLLYYYLLLQLQVNAANDAVYEDIAAGFIQLCSSLLPSLEVQVDRTGSQAHEGLQFR